MFHSRIVLIGIVAALLLGSCSENPINPPYPPPVPKPVVPIPPPVPTPTNTEAPSASRVALVIGNGNYKGQQAFIGKLPFKKLDNPVNDAVDMAKVLGDLGFNVILKTDVANKTAMNKAVWEFKQMLPKDGRAVGLFYFSGHGFQHKNTNYLVPLQAQMNSDIDIEGQAFNTDYVLRHLEKFNPNGVNLVVLDACRDSIPEDFFEDRANKGSFSDQLKAGFTQLQAPIGSLIAYSTAPNTTAWGGLPGERNSVYTKHLLTAIKAQPQLNVTHLLMKVRKGVRDETKNETKPQAPWDSVSLTAPFCFKEPCASGDSLSPEQLAKLEIQQQENDKLREQLANKEREKERLRQQLAQQEREKERLRQQLTQPQQPEQQPPPPTSTGNVFRDRLKNGGYGPQMVWIPAGQFRMGDIQGGGGSDEQPVHSVSVKKFAMGVYEVTFAEYDKFADATGRRKPNDYGWGRGNRPVVNVSWHDANAYMEWLSQQTGHQYRLPTEAEWEYAARAGTTTKYWWGNDIGSNKANCSNRYCGDSFDYTAPVGSFAKNPFGLYDTVGNVWEWTCSKYTNKYNGQEQQCVDSAGYFVLRGGAWSYNATWARSASRINYDPAYRYNNYGFRPARIQ